MGKDYYLVDVKDIDKKLFAEEDCFLMSDTIKSFTQIGLVNGSQLFEELPDDFRKIIIEIPRAKDYKENSREFSKINHSFDVKINKKFNKLTGTDILDVDNLTWIDNSGLLIESFPKKITQEQAQKFYLALVKLGLHDTYMKSLYNLYDYKFDIFNGESKRHVRN